jgi:hypothetical protein
MLHRLLKEANAEQLPLADCQPTDTPGDHGGSSAIWGQPKRPREDPARCLLLTAAVVGDVAL